MKIQIDDKLTIDTCDQTSNRYILNISLDCISRLNTKLERKLDPDNSIQKDKLYNFLILFRLHSSQLDMGLVLWDSWLDMHDPKDIVCMTFDHAQSMNQLCMILDQPLYHNWKRIIWIKIYATTSHRYIIYFTVIQKCYLIISTNLKPPGHKVHSLLLPML